MQTVNWIQVSPDGEIVASGTVQDVLIEQVPLVDGAELFVGVIGSCGSIFDRDTGAVIELPPRNSVCESFDYAARQWVDRRGYKEKRMAEYPPVGDQLDSLFHAGLFPADMAAKLAEVKERYPK